MTSSQNGNASRVRGIHAIPDGPEVDVYVDGNRVLQNLAFKDVSDYLEFEPGRYTVQVAPAGQGQGSAVVDEQVTLDANTDYTIAAGGTLESPKAFVFVDENQVPPENQARLRAVHLSPDAPAVDIAAEGNVLVKGLKYGTASEYVEVPAGSYSIEVRPAGSNEAVATFDVNLEGGTVVSAFAVGFLQTNDDAQAFDLLPVVDAPSGMMTTTTMT
ncbi:DUF4397 domain-containing protein [Haladaptatus sp. CMAA 1911]|uniref:DUF4397 domain-containing protein n=1 Tax=unclassified Haladaptatus TaxID=2622732 RepID=UPI0037548492